MKKEWWDLEALDKGRPFELLFNNKMQNFKWCRDL